MKLESPEMPFRLLSFSRLRDYCWFPALLPFMLLLLSELAILFTASNESHQGGGSRAGMLRKSPAFDPARCLREPSASRGMCAPPGRRFLVVVPTECDEIQRVYLKPQLVDPNRKFDTLVMDWSEDRACDGKLGGLVDHIEHIPLSFKYHGMWEIFTRRHPELLRQYDYFGLIDDDIVYHTGAQGVLDVFLHAAAGDLFIAQGSLSNTSFVAHPTLKHNETVPGSNARLTKWVEVMTPVLCREALLTFLGDFKGQTHAWGLDGYWSHTTINRLRKRLGVIDAVQVEHRQKVDLGLTKVYQRIGGIERAWAEMQATLQQRLHFNATQLHSWRINTRLNPGEHIFIDASAIRSEPWLQPGGISAHKPQRPK